jgi:alpha-ketoglutarate-dependent taurine dioxygenase
MRFPASEVPRLTPEQIRALDAVDAVAADPRVHLDMRFRPGDIQLVNNFVVMHARSSYDDWADPGRRRHLLRLWLATPTGRPVPPAFIGSREFPFDRETIAGRA